MVVSGAMRQLVNSRLVIWLLGGLLAWIGSTQEFTQKEQAWWAFQAVRDPAVPKEGAEWSRNEIDRFIARQHAAHKVAPAKTASRRTLIRRVTFDLTGLPPTPKEVALFLGDSSPDAYPNLVGRLLASPRYGERQATFWLDLVRYAESDGYRADAYRPEVWRYRDYVIESFNSDKPYDVFVREQLAGDEINPGNQEAHTATMFLRHWIYEHNQRDVETQWEDILNDVTDVTSDVFLGMGIQCARCHDHKFDPILQRDYYRLQAFFTPLLPRESMGIGTLTQRAAYQKAYEAWALKTETIRSRLHEIERPVLLKHATREGFDKFVDEIKTMIRKRQKDRSAYERQIAEMAERQFDVEPEKLPERLKGATKKEWVKLQAELKKQPAPEPLLQMKFVVSDAGPIGPPTVIPKKGISVEPGFPSILDPNPAHISPPPAALQSTGRRTALAKWITHSGNPLTPRVMVNRLWQQHFGRGLAANTSDFGNLGEKPTHPELLDWLATRFIKDGWSLKKMHWLIATSATYQQSSNNPAAEKKDPANIWLARAPIRRLDAEQARDGLLTVSGELDLKAGGQGVDGTKVSRRSVYIKIMRNKPDDVLHAFDAPDRISHIPQRNVTTTSTQSLMMMNSEWTRKRAAAFAQRLEKLHPQNTAKQVRAAYELAFGRTPTSTQLDAALEFLQSKFQSLVMTQPKGPEIGMFGKRTPSPAALLKVGSSQRSLEVSQPKQMLNGDFTVEAFIQLNSLFPDSSVRTIVSQWNSSKASPGWAFGITSAKSSHKPRNLILQLTGVPQRGDHGYEVIASDLRPELNKPYFAAVSVKFDETGAGKATFFLRDLTTENGKMQAATKLLAKNKHYANQQAPVIGGRAGITGHSWDGLIDNVRLSSIALKENQTLLYGEVTRKDTLAFWKFAKASFYSDSSLYGNTLEPKGIVPINPALALLSEYCHVLLNSNEFIYVD